jgi:hypothetical protein
LVAAAAGVVALGSLVGVVLVDEDDDEDDLASATTTTSLFTTTSLATTTLPGATSSTTAASTASTTSTTRATTTSSSSTTSTTRATTTSSSTAPAAICGTGRASVSFVAKDLTTDVLSSSFTPQANVDNQVSAPIEVEQITLEVVFPGNDVRTVNFSTAGTVIPAGNSASFTAEKITTAQRYESVRFTRFTYFTQGQPTACRVTTP